MDTSEEYIKMCDCPEIQEQWKPTIGDYLGGDWFIDDQDNIGKTFLGIVQHLNPDGKSDLVNTGGDIHWSVESNIWLPRQDQLQEMAWNIGAGYSNLWFLLQDFQDFVFDDYADATSEDIIPIGTLISMEQLWLAFYMKQQYNKTWNGEEWVKEQ